MAGDPSGPADRVASTVEVEQKFRVHGLFRLPDLDDQELTLDPPEVSELAADYLDTDDLRLARWGVSLRRREGGTDAGWHLKLPVAAGVREELTLPLGAGTVDAPPDALTDLVLALTRTAPLSTAAALRTERTARTARAPDGTALVVLTDDSVSVLDGGRVVARFRELELELVDADDERGATAAAMLGRRLVAAGAVAGGPVSKVARALGPLAAAEPDVPEPAAVGPGEPAVQAVQAHLARNTRALLAQDVRVRRDLPDSVHQMRVAARRLRSGLKVFEPLLDEAVTTRLRLELAWIAGVLGEVRDREVLRARLLRDLAAVAADPTTEVDTTAARRLIGSSLGRDLGGARTKVLAAMRSDRYLALLDSLVDACTRPPATAAGDVSCARALPPLVDRAWRRLAKDVARLDADGADAAWHEARIAAKRARYACEAVEPVFGKPARKLAERVELVTELLGEHQDAALAADAVRALGARDRTAGPTGFVLGLLHAYERDAVRESRAELTRIWPEVSRKAHRSWLKDVDG